MDKIKMGCFNSSFCEFASLTQVIQKDCEYKGYKGTQLIKKI